MFTPIFLCLGRVAEVNVGHGATGRMFGHGDRLVGQFCWAMLGLTTVAALRL